MSKIFHNCIWNDDSNCFYKNEALVQKYNDWLNAAENGQVFLSSDFSNLPDKVNKNYCSRKRNMKIVFKDFHNSINWEDGVFLGGGAPQIIRSVIAQARE